MEMIEMTSSEFSESFDTRLDPQLAALFGEMGVTLEIISQIGAIG